MITGSRIALVDDDPAVRDATATLLEQSGADVTQFESGETFLAQHSISSFDLVLLDIRMPGMSGIEVLRALGDRAERTPVIVLSGHGETAIAVEAMMLGAVAFIDKPYHPDELLEAVRRAVEGRAAEPGQAGK